MERLNDTLRERIKVQRGWKKIATPVCEGQRIHYNFVKLHMALNGETLAKRARINVVKNGNKWMDLLELAIRDTTK